ncbi:hypothetical protein L3Q82_026078 [Scortum barcoo]|uniref:Uncharacterized protein n=1 Tax=Scortum barcoo TaxID=214431 RepID=A0ACB8WR01_9TELE|nr:hypothetical protein L3Q82_026078 [Scortum barcoo]
MMKLILSLTLIWALSSTAGALQCQTCTDLTCSSTVSLPCTTETTMCATFTIQVPAQTNNNLQCFTCNGTDCSTKLQCVGIQDRCFKANYTLGNNTTPLFGCVSKSVCDTITNLENLPVIQNVTGNFTSGPSCCSSNLCNDACCFRLGVPHLLLGLLIFTLY